MVFKLFVPRPAVATHCNPTTPSKTTINRT